MLAGCEPKPPKPKASTASTGKIAPGAWAALQGAGAMEPEAAWSPLGIQVREAPEAARQALGIEHGVMVVRLRPPASRTRLLPGDIIVGVNLASFRGIQEFNRLVEEAQREAQRGALALLVRRSDADLYITLEAPEQEMREGSAAGGGGPEVPWPRRPATGKPLRT
jgi:hypothetical protein